MLEWASSIRWNLQRPSRRTATSPASTRTSMCCEMACRDDVSPCFVARRAHNSKSVWSSRSASSSRIARRVESASALKTSVTRWTIGKSILACQPGARPPCPVSPSSDANPSRRAPARRVRPETPLVGQSRARRSLPPASATQGWTQRVDLTVRSRWTRPEDATRGARSCSARPCRDVRALKDRAGSSSETPWRCHVIPAGEGVGRHVGRDVSRLHAAWGYCIDIRRRTLGVGATLTLVDTQRAQVRGVADRWSSRGVRALAARGPAQPRGEVGAGPRYNLSAYR